MYNTVIKNKENNLIGGNKNEVQQADYHEARGSCIRACGQLQARSIFLCLQRRHFRYRHPDLRSGHPAAEKEGKESGWNYKVVCNDWVKGSHNRTYVSARIYTNAWNRKRDLEIGYIDNMTGALVAA